MQATPKCNNQFNFMELRTIMMDTSMILNTYT